MSTPTTKKKKASSNSREELRRHPMFAVLAMAMGEDEAEKVLKLKLDEIDKQNQSSVEFSKSEKKITIPNSMNKLQAAQELERQWEDEETMIDVARSFDNWNWKDVLVAVKKAAERHFGWVQGKTVYTFFGPERPKEISVVVDVKGGVKMTEECFYGRFSASVWEDCSIDVGPQSISAEVKKRYANEVREFFDLIQNILDTESIYRGKSITVTKQTDPWGEVSLDFEVFELKISNRIVLNQDLDGIVKNFIIDDLGEEGKRCYLFSGGYGNGKTETAMRVGGAGLSKGMAYFYCKDAEVFHMLLKQAVNYQPCIVFLEDIDEIGAGDKRDADMNRILNTLDGVQTKGNNLTVIFTTNHEQRINPALRRPGRIDLVANFGNPDTDSVEKILRAYFEDVEGSEVLNYAELAKLSPDVSGAVIAEIAKRAVKLCKKRGTVSDELVKAAIASMKHHLDLMKEPVEQDQNGDMVILLKGANITTKSMNGEVKAMEAVLKK